MERPIVVSVTGAAGQIGYSLLFRLAAGEAFGPERPVFLKLLEIPAEGPQKALRGVAMELEDCAFPLLAGMSLHSDPREAFADAQWCLLVGAKPRGPGMERADLLLDNARIFVEQGRAIDEVAAADCRVVVVGNPCNTNCMIAASQARRLPPDRFTAMTRLDENRAVAQLAKKTGRPVTDVTNMIVFGNHSPTMVADFENARIGGKPATEVIGDRSWLEGEFLETVGKRGAAIIQARGASSAASAANALIGHVRSLFFPSDALHSVAVRSEGWYGFAEGVWASVPVRCTAPGEWEVDRSFRHSEFLAEKLRITNEELVRERETVREMIGPSA